MAQRPNRTRKLEPDPTHALGTRVAESTKLAGDIARKVLGEESSDIDTLKLLSAIEAVFESWKQQHGDRNPTAMMKAQGRLAAGRKPIPFADAAPYQCAGPTVANNIDLALKLFAEYRPFVQLSSPYPENVMLVVLGTEIESHPDVDPSSVIRALSMCVRWTAGWERVADMLAEDLFERGRRLQESTRFQRGLSKGAAAGGAAVKRVAQLKRSQCIDIDNELLRNPAKRSWSLNDRTDFVHKKMREQATPGKKAPAWGTVKDYLKNNKRAFLKSMKA